MVNSKPIESALVPNFHNQPYSETISQVHEFLPELKWASIIREIHTFWDQLSLWEKGWEFGQHVGFGKKLIAESEKISKDAWYSKIAVIAGVWVRQYYEKRWYRLEGEYMVKEL